MTFKRNSTTRFGLHSSTAAACQHVQVSCVLGLQPRSAGKHLFCQCCTCTQNNYQPSTCLADSCLKTPYPETRPTGIYSLISLLDWQRSGAVDLATLTACNQLMSWLCAHNTCHGNGIAYYMYSGLFKNMLHSEQTYVNWGQASVAEVMNMYASVSISTSSALPKAAGSMEVSVFKLSHSEVAKSRPTCC